MEQAPKPPVMARRLSEILDDEHHNNPPTYSESGTSIQSLIDKLKAGAENSLPITGPPEKNPGGQWSEHSLLVTQALDTYFSAIQTKKDEVVALLIETGIVTANTTSRDGVTPLLAAVEAGNVRMVQELIDFDADVNTYGSAPHNRAKSWNRKDVQRTPLQFAAAKGNLTLVKLLMEVYHANDALIAPDGQLALRLAIQNGHREIAAYLPARRGGGWRRWKAHHAKAVKRAQAACKQIVEACEFLFWELPKILVWELPREVFKWIKRDLHKLPGWCKKQVLKTPERMKRLGKGIVKAVRSIPMVTKKIAVRFWSLLKTIANGLLWIVNRAASLLHSAAHAILTFLQKITLQDLVNGVRGLACAMFVDFPKAVGRGLLILGGGFFWTLRCLVKCLWAVATWFPKKLLQILGAMGSSVVKGVQEVLICVNPKGGMKTS
ncbi:MAG: hypothetical protein HETSPECPRED_007972 [Heterodermia speciosa]|uniref:Ankyrin n=1 Tax=Heterodermia speciosa TaxID=116794 RepID=A0A8H3ESD3_9LECA|nr:MAG: hypothetical protein HETSPECPRED_007972 [Heterodermia speciosa]